MKNIYLDYAATTPCDARVYEAMCPFFTDIFANANSPHQAGQLARKSLEDARALTASHLNAHMNDIIFTSGATESNNHVINGIVDAAAQLSHLIVSTIEHHCIIEPVNHLLKLGKIEVTWINPNQEGVIDPQAIKAAIKSNTVLVIVHHANNQIGTIEDITAIAAICRDKGVKFLVDAVQTVGHIPVNVASIGCDFLSLSAHKFYGPKGIGALYVRKGVNIPSLILGGDQERGRRSGTVNVAGAVGLARALDMAAKQLSEDMQHDSELRNQLITGIVTTIEGVHLNGHATARLPNNVNITIDSIDSEQLITALDLAGIACSMGSACTAGRLTPSHVLKAIGLSDAAALGSLRLTVGRLTTQDDIKYCVEQLANKVKQLRA